MSLPHEISDQPDTLPVLQLQTWLPADQPLQVLIGGGCVVTFLWWVQRATGSLWITGGAFLILAASLWRIWLPIQFELDSRGLQQIVLGRRSFWPWSDFARHEVDPEGVALIREPRVYPLARVQGVYLPARRRHLELVQLVDTYVTHRVVERHRATREVV